MLRAFDRECDEKMSRIHVVFGAYHGEIDAQPGEKVVFIGDCAEWQGALGDRLVQIRNVYKHRSTQDPRTAQHKDIFAKLATVTKALLSSGKEPFVRLEGCPVSIAEQVFLLARLGQVQNPYFEPSQVAGFTQAYLQWRAANVRQRLAGDSYHKDGPCQRGAAAPELSPLRPQS